jgi:transcriptional regulator of arginine metabolism
MKARAARLAAIRRTIGQEAVDSQERLVELLEKAGFPVTQATLSRDLKYLGIGKVPNASGGYTYTLPEAEARPGTGAALVQDFLRGFVSLEWSGTFALVKTLPGHAASVASALDNLRVEGLLGTVAGDDTILVVPRDGVQRQRLQRALRERIPGIAPAEGGRRSG